MIITVEELRQYITTDLEDQALEARLQALELLIRGYTNNNFQVRQVRGYGKVEDGLFIMNAPLKIKEGNTVQKADPDGLQQLLTVNTVDGNTFTVNEDTWDEDGVMVTLVHYPMDVKMGAVNLMRWELDMREKAGIQSESISRHSVTYQNMDTGNAPMGYPASMMGFLKPYMRARFGRGIGV